jgi:hypothetical protein
MCARKGADPESAATDLEARETVGIGNATISKASPQDPQATPKFWRAATCRVAALVVGERHRRDMGDLAGLAASMADGLLHPIVVRPDRRFGEGQ